MMKLDWTYEGDSTINLGINITDSVAILLDDSGTGKTFMFEMLESYFVANGIAYKKFDYNSENEDTISLTKNPEKATTVLCPKGIFISNVNPKHRNHKNLNYN